MANKIQTLAFELGDPLAEKLGMYIVDIQFKREEGTQVLRVFIDKEGGVGIDDCETFSRSFEEILDRQDPIESEYLLEVSSPGVDRQLKTDREFCYYVGREVDVKLYKAEKGKKEFSGELVDYSDKIAHIRTDGELLKINIKDAAFIKLHFGKVGF